MYWNTLEESYPNHNEVVLTHSYEFGFQCLKYVYIDNTPLWESELIKGKYLNPEITKWCRVETPTSDNIR